MVKSFCVCFSGRRRTEETTHKTWVRRLILIVVSINYSAISGNSSLSHHRCPLCNGKVDRNSELGDSVSQHCYKLHLSFGQFFSAGVTRSASSQEPGGFITRGFKDLWTLLGRGLLKFNVILSSSWSIHFRERERGRVQRLCCAPKEI